MSTLSLLPGCRIDEIRRAGSGTLILVAHSRRGGVRCPDCGRMSRAVHSRYRRSPADLPALGRGIRISLRVRRFYCRAAACPRRTFAERFGSLLAPFARRTRRLGNTLARIGIALGGAAGARLARELSMPVSGDTLLRAVRGLPLPETAGPRVVGVDDWALRRGRTYGTIVVDLERRRVLDLLADRSAETLAAWLRERSGIEVVARDRSTEYARAATMGAGKATQIADRWHLLANARQMVERWLAGVHGRLRRLAPPHPGGSAAPGKRTRAFPRSRAEQSAGAAVRARWLAVYEEVRRRHAAGETLIGIGRALGLARGTVRKFAQAESYPERAARAPGPSLLDPFVPHLEARVAAGCENGAALWRELRDLGYSGTAKQVHRWLQDRRTAPAKTMARRWRRGARARAARAGGASPLLSPKRLAWALVWPPEALDAEEAAAVARVGRDPEAARVAGLARRFTGIVRAARKADARGGDVAELDAWLAEARSSGVAALETFAAGLEQDGTAVRAALTTPWSSGQTEGQINRLKLLKRQMYGRAGLDLLRRRTLLAA